MKQEKDWILKTNNKILYHHNLKYFSHATNTSALLFDSLPSSCKLNLPKSNCIGRHFEVIYTIKLCQITVIIL